MKGFGSTLCSTTKRLDGGLQVDDLDECAALQSALCEFREEALDGIQPR